MWRPLVLALVLLPWSVWPGPAVLGPRSAFAQDAATVDAANAATEQRPALDLGALGRETSKGIIAGMGLWLEDWLSETGPLVLVRAALRGLGWLGQQLLGGLDAAAGAGGTTDMLTHLSTSVTLDDETVRSVWAAGRLLLNGLIGVGLLVVGFGVLVRFGGVQAGEVGVLLPRIALGVVLVNGSMDYLRGAVGGANGLGDYLTRGTAGFSQIVGQQLSSTEAGGWLLGVAVMGALLFVQRVLMHGVLDVLTMTMPLALAAWMFPMWSAWFWRWANLLVALLAGSVLQSLLLAAGAGMLGRAIAATADGEPRRLVAGVVAVGVLGLTSAAPALVGLGLVGGAVSSVARRLVDRRRMTPPPPRPAPDAGDAPGPEEHVREVPVSGGAGPQTGGAPSPPIRMIVYTRVPSLPDPNAGGGSHARLALPPPDYLKE